MALTILITTYVTPRQSRIALYPVSMGHVSIYFDAEETEGCDKGSLPTKGGPDEPR
jgi:hypothetical protein